MLVAPQHQYQSQEKEKKKKGKKKRQELPFLALQSPITLLCICCPSLLGGEDWNGKTGRMETNKKKLVAIFFVSYVFFFVGVLILFFWIPFQKE